MRTVIVLATILLIPAVAFSATIIVPDDQPTIQAGIDAAVDGDTVVVKPGTYVENIDFKGKAIILQSQQGASSTVIDGNKSSSVVTFISNEGPDCILDGFTLTNGMRAHGGGIYCHNASPTMKNNFLSKNSAVSSGGAIHFYNSTSQLINNNFLENVATHNHGGAIYCSAAPISITNSMILGNSATLHGGGIHCSNHSSLTITNTTISGNSSGTGGGGIFCTHYAHPVITNTILWDNSSSVGPEIRIGKPGSGASTLTISYSDVKGGLTSVHVDPQCTLYWGPGMVDADPLFFDSQKGDFHLTYPSPCLNAGDNAASGIPVDDFEGDPRIALGTVDMGADEFHNHLYYTGDAVIGGSVDLNFVGLPGSSQLGLWIALDAMKIPFSGICGDWYLLPPYIGPFYLGAIPSNGVYVLSGTIPSSPPAPYTMYMQASIGWYPMKLTNLCTMDVQ